MKPSSTESAVGLDVTDTTQVRVHIGSSIYSDLKEEFRILMESLGLPFVIYDKELIIRYWGNVTEKIVEGKHLVGKHLTEAFEVSTESLEFYKAAVQANVPMTLPDQPTVDPRLPRRLRISTIPLGDETAVFYENNDPAHQQVAAIHKSHERFRRLSDSLSVALIMLDATLNVSYWNTRAEQLSGLASDQVVGKPARDVFPLITEDLIGRCLRAVETKSSFEISQLRYKDRNVNGYFGIRAFPVDDELAVLIEDKTEQVRGEEQIRASEERFRRVSENMALAFLLVDQRGKVTYWNKMAEITSGGIPAEQILGRDVLEALPISAETWARMLEGTRSSAEGIKMRVRPERPNVQGTYDVRAFVVGDEVGLVVEDVTKQVTQAAELDRSNQQLLDLYHNAPCGYLTVWPNGKIERINQRMTTWLGFTVPEEIVGSVIGELLTPASREVLESQLVGANLEAPVANLELEFLNTTSSAFWGLVNALPIFDPVIQNWYWRWTVIDITEVRAAQRQIEDNRLFTQLFNELGEAVLISDKSGRIIRANKAASRILGISTEELTNLTHDSSVWQAVLDDGTPVPISELPGVRALREKRPVTNLEIGVVRPDGKLTWILESAAPLFDDSGDVTGVIVTFPEVTATVQQRQSLKDLNEKYQIERDRANEANRLKSSFLANMSHEIRTPMTAILGFSDILAGELSGKVSEQHYTFLRSINVSGKRLLNLINDILDLSKIEAGRLELHMEELDLSSEIEASVTPLAWIAKQKGLVVNVEPMNERLMIRGDRQRFGQVLTNIISNAIKFTRAGSIAIRVVPLNGPFPHSQRHVAIEVEDTGIGISKDFLPYLFEEFRQEHTGVTKEFGGTGLGLAISRRLVSLMGGSVHVRSQQGVGTVFGLEFPLESRGNLVAKPHSTAPVVAPPASKMSPEQLTSQKHVLVVEDNHETQRLLEVYLKMTYRVSQAMNAEEAFMAIDKDTPDVILMDVNLPGKDGLTITREIRGGTKCPNVPIVALTAFAMTGDKQRCLDAGCNDYLSKPATKREVLDVIAKAFASQTSQK